MCRQCSSGLQAVASVAASIRAGFYTIGLAGGVETMSTNPMAWNGGVNPKLDQNQQAADCLLPMGAQCLLSLHTGLLVMQLQTAEYGHPVQPWVARPAAHGCALASRTLPWDSQRGTSIFCECLPVCSVRG